MSMVVYKVEDVDGNAVLVTADYKLAKERAEDIFGIVMEQTYVYEDSELIDDFRPDGPPCPKCQKATRECSDTPDCWHCDPGCGWTGHIKDLIAGHPKEKHDELLEKWPIE